MAVSVVPALIDALVAQSEANIPDVNIFDGVADSEDAGDYLMIGVDDPDGPDWARSMSGTRGWESVGLEADVNEVGDIACAALSWNGQGDQKLARDTVYGIAEALQAVCRANPSLGVANLEWVLFGTNTDLMQIKTTHGALARLEFQIHFQALI